MQLNSSNTVPAKYINVIFIFQPSNFEHHILLQPSYFPLIKIMLNIKQTILLRLIDT